MATKLRVEGTKEMVKVLKKLPDVVARRLIAGAVRKGAQVVLREAQRRAPVGRESRGRVRLRRSTGGRVSVSNFGKLKLELKVVTIPRRLLRPSAVAGAAVTVGKAFWGMFVEFGTRHTSAQPFLRPAFEQTHRRALVVMGKSLKQGIDRQLKKMVKQNRRPRRTRR